MKWVKLDSRFISDPRITKLPDQVQLILLKCMGLEANGYLDPSYLFELDEDLAASLGVSNEEWAKARDLLLFKGLLERGVNGYKTNYNGALVFSDNRPNASTWKDLRRIVFERDNYTCQYCGKQSDSLECDHVIPISRGGSNEIENLCAACKTCNRSKSDRTPEEWMRGEA